jgi:hypothetical protein
VLRLSLSANVSLMETAAPQGRGLLIVFRSALVQVDTPPEPVGVST